MFRKIALHTLLFTLLLAGCLPVGSFEVGVEPSAVDTPLVVTQEPAPVDEPAQQPTDPPDSPQSPGAVTGDVCFPSEFIPEMTAFFRNLETAGLVELPIAQNQPAYEIELPAGEYTAFAYLLDQQDFGGSYSAAVACGLNAECSDHSLLPFTVLPGETTAGVDLCDWYAPESLPANPNARQPADAALAGLVFQSTVSGDLWQVGADGQARQLANLYEASLSPDGRRALYAQDGDIWLQDLTTGISSNLTNTADREESGPQWWPANPDLIVFHSFPFNEERGYSSGQVTVMHLDGSGYTVIDENLSGFPPALHPDGHTIAYVSDGAWLYHVEDGAREPFDPQLYGLEDVRLLTSPAWSPDGTRLAMWVHGNFGVGDQVALGVFDIDGSGLQLLHPYTPISMEGGNPTPAWSPDGQWLASTVIGDQVRGSLWVFRVDGVEEINLGNSAYPMWSPAEDLLAFVRWPENGGPAQEATLATASADDWTLGETSMPPGSVPVAWQVP